MSKPRRVKVLDVPVDRVDMQAAVDVVQEHIRSGQGPGTVLAVNPEKVYALREDPFLMRFFEGAMLLLPDGVGVAMAMRLLYRFRQPRVPGADLMLELCRVAELEGYGVFIYGAREDVNRRSAEILRESYPGLRIVGRANGYLPSEEMGTLVGSINASGADILLVALGSPRQERWMYEHLPSLDIRICQGIGGTLDTITGDVKRAPDAFRRLGLEWLYRLLKQPGRWRRQIVYPRFVIEVLKQAVTTRRPMADP